MGALRAYAAGLVASVLMLGGAAVHGAEIKIGVVGPMTGQYAVFGEQLGRGAELAVADINASGGVMGHKLVLEVGDDACDPRQAVSVANEMVANDVQFVDGHFCSSSSIPASAVYAEAGILQITPASTEPGLTDDAAEKGWWNVFRACGRNDQQGTVAADYLLAHFKDQNIAIINDKTAAGKGLADQVKKVINAAGVEETMFESITAGERDFAALVSKMKQAGIDVIYFGGYHTEAGLLVRQAREKGLDAVLIGPDSLMTQEFWSITGPAGEGVLMTFAPDPRNIPEAREVVARLEAQGYDPEGYTLYSYAAVQIFAEGARRAQSLDNQAIAKALRNGTPMKTVIGTIEYDKKGDIVQPQFVLYRWHDGAYETF